MNIENDLKKGIIGAEFMKDQLVERYDLLAECEITATLLERYFYILRILDEEHMELFHMSPYPWNKHIYHLHIACSKESLLCCTNQLDSLTSDEGLYGLEFSDILNKFEKNQNSQVEFQSCNIKDQNRLHALYEYAKEKNSVLLFFKGNYGLLDVNKYVDEFDDACDLNDTLWQCVFSQESEDMLYLWIN